MNPDQSIPNQDSEQCTPQTDYQRELWLDSLARLAGGVAHDLNNILTPLLMAVQLLRKDPPAAQRTELLDAARAGVARGSALVQRLLAISGTAIGDRLPVQLDAIVDEVRAYLEKNCTAGVQFRTEIAGGLWPILGDATQITEALRHLGENARDAVVKGGKITVAVSKVILTPTDITDQPQAVPGRYAVLSVADNGPGIPTDIQDRVFDPFYTTKPFGRGTGLGLTLARGIARSHGGFLRVESKVNHGARFSMYFPAAESVAQVADAVAPKPVQRHGATILIVDDEPHIARLASIALESHGYTALTAHSGTEALNLYSLHRDKIRLVLLDLMMPDMDGATTLKNLREIDPDVRIIAASGRPSNVEGEVQGFLRKPYDAESVVACVDNLVQRSPTSHSPP